MLRLICCALLIFTLPGGAALAAEPAAGQRQPLADTGWYWTLDAAEGQTLRLSGPQGGAAVYDISDCMFCSGEEDNCQQDGIHPLPLPDNEPALAVICHVGAHSQQAQVVAPLRDRQQPVFRVTGNYWVEHQLSNHGLTVNYDRRESNGEFSVHSARWPAPAADK